jgi:transposase
MPMIMIEASPSADPSGLLAAGTSRQTTAGGDRRRCYTNSHQVYCGIDLPARAIYVCLLRHDGETWLHRHLPAAPAPFLKAVAPARAGLVGAVEGMFTGDWLADLCAQAGLAFVLGHALDMKAIHGGKAKHDTIESHPIATLRRGGMLPLASVYPAEMRGTRDLLRRRTPLMRKRAARLAPGQNTNAPYHLPDIGTTIASTANRAGVAERFHAPAVHKTSAGDLALITADEARRRDLELALVKTAQQPAAHTLYLRQTAPGMGNILSRVLRDESHDLGRFPRVQALASYARVVKCRQEAAGQRLGPSGKKSGHAHRKWACSEAAPLCLRTNPNGQKLLTRLEKTQGPGKALTILAHQVARAVSDMLKRNTAFELDIFLQA